MTRMRWAAAALTAAAFVLGAVVGGGRPEPVSAQNTISQSLPPIFRPDAVVTYGTSGIELHVLQVHGEWIYVSRDDAFGTDNYKVTPDSERFWLHVPSIAESWALLR